MFRREDMSLMEVLVLELVVSSAFSLDVVSLIAAVIAVFWAAEVDTLVGMLDMGGGTIGCPLWWRLLDAGGGGWGVASPCRLPAVKSISVRT